MLFCFPLAQPFAYFPTQNDFHENILRCYRLAIPLPLCVKLVGWFSRCSVAKIPSFVSCRSPPAPPGQFDFCHVKNGRAVSGVSAGRLHGLPPLAAEGRAFKHDSPPGAPRFGGIGGAATGARTPHPWGEGAKGMALAWAFLPAKAKVTQLAPSCGFPLVLQSSWGKQSKLAGSLKG